MTNLTSGGTVEQIATLVKTGCMSPLCDLLVIKDDKTVSVILDAFTNILAAAERMGELEKVTLMIEECEGLDKLENLQNHENDEIYHKAQNIIESFFPSDDAVGEEPSSTSAGFNFDAPQQNGDQQQQQFNF